MSDTKTLIAELDQKVEQLIEHAGKLSESLQVAKKEVNELRVEIGYKESEIKSLKEENEALQNAPAESKTDNEDMKVRIGELVKEIDNCISLLKV